MGKRKGGNPEQKSKRLKSFTVLEPGWKGIFVTCARNKETNCRAELVPLIEEYVEMLYPQENEGPEEEPKGDIEDLIASEVAALGEKKQRLVEGHLIGCECVIFIRLKKDIDPIKIVEKICKDAMDDDGKRTRYVQKLTPICELVHASLDNLPKLESYIRQGFQEKGLTFAIRASVRNSNVVKEDVISATARLVGPDHKVNLKQYERLILLECFKSSIGLSVVDSRYDEYGRFNLQQIYEKKLVEQKDNAFEKRQQPDSKRDGVVDKPENKPIEDKSIEDKVVKPENESAETN